MIHSPQTSDVFIYLMNYKAHLRHEEGIRMYSKLKKYSLGTNLKYFGTPKYSYAK